MEAFEQLGLSHKTLVALKKKGFVTPTEIQKKAIPLLLEGRMDVIGQSQTGTGKTASFALPILEKINPGKQVQSLILTPTRELALQVSKEIESLSTKQVRVLTVYGGAPIKEQLNTLKKGVDIVVGTPGRIIDFLKRKALVLNHIKFMVLDEADEMLNMGFVEDIEIILAQTPKEKSMLLFSATMPKPILNIAKKYMRKYELVKVENAITNGTIEQVYYSVNAKDRLEALRRIIDYHADFYGIIFCNTKVNVDGLVQQLSKHYPVAALHGDITQGQREKILQSFRKKSISILIATDVAARGIDVNDLTHVVNYSLPQSPESYVHRIGRTGRAGKKGVSITFVIPSERRKLAFVEKINKCKIEKRSLPTADAIVRHRETLVKQTIQSIVEANKGRSSKFTLIADELLKVYPANEVIGALLKYSFRDQLQKQYKDIAEPQVKQEHRKKKGNARPKKNFRRSRRRR